MSKVYILYKEDNEYQFDAMGDKIEVKDWD